MPCRLNKVIRSGRLSFGQVNILLSGGLLCLVGSPGPSWFAVSVLGRVGYMLKSELYVSKAV